MWAPSGHAADPGPERTDASGGECLRRLRRGDPEALEELLQSYWHRLVSYAEHLVGGKTDLAEDLVQEAFVRLWERRASWAETSLPAPILYTIVRNLAHNERRNGTTRALLLRLRSFSAVVRRTPEDDLEQRELEDAIEAAVEALPPRRREIFLLARNHGLSYAEIATIMSISARTVANQMSSALASLRDSLRPFLRGTEPDR